MSEINNYYDAYQRYKRERISACDGLMIAKRQEKEKERLVKKGILTKTVTYNPELRLTTIHYEKVEGINEKHLQRLRVRDVEYDALEP